MPPKTLIVARASPLKQIAQIAREVKHQGGGTRVRLCKGDAHSEGLDADAARNRKTGDKAARIRAHVRARLVIVSYAQVPVGAGHKIGPENKVSEKVAAKAVLALEITRIGAVAALVIRHMPFGQVPGCHRKTYGQRAESLRPPQAQVYGQSVVTIVEFLDLAAEIGRNKRQRQVFLVVVIVDAQICGKCHSRVSGVGAVQKLDVDAATQPVGNVIRVLAAEAHILCRERPGDIARFISLFHRAIAVVLYRSAPSAVSSHLLAVAQPGKIGTSDVSHVIKRQLAAHLLPEQGGILVGGHDVIVYQRYIHSAKTVNLRGRGDIEKTIRLVAITSECA